MLSETKQNILDSFTRKIDSNITHSLSTGSSANEHFYWLLAQQIQDLSQYESQPYFHAEDHACIHRSAGDESSYLSIAEQEKSLSFYSQTYHYTASEKLSKDLHDSKQPETTVHLFNALKRYSLHPKAQAEILSEDILNNLPWHIAQTFKEQTPENRDIHTEDSDLSMDAQTEGHKIDSLLSVLDYTQA